MTISPYNLKAKSESQDFYQDLSLFTNTVIKQGKKDYQRWLSDYMQFTKQKKWKSYTNNEHLMEFLMIGLFWNNYHKKFSAEHIFLQPIFNILYKTRKKIPALKNKSDILRGKLSTAILMKNRQINVPLNQRFEFMNSWLICSKEFNQELERLKHWQFFIERKHMNLQQDFWNCTTTFADWFTAEANVHLGQYTHSWQEFMMDTSQVYPKREDHIFCTRKPNEYHLNMVAAEIINRALSEDFNQAKEKIVLLPTCMTTNTSCKAKVINGHLKCQNCDQNCHVAKLNTTLNKKGYSTVLIPHSSSFSKYLEPWKNQNDTALVGVACVLNLLTGGYEMQKLNIPSQCVFLDTCGCEKHWLSNQATNINSKQLDDILANKPAHKQQMEKAHKNIHYA